MQKESVNCMENQLAISSDMTTEVIDNASRFTEFLSSETVAPVRKSLTLIPNIIADILNVALENEKLKRQDKQFERKAEIIQSYLELQDRNLQRQFQVDI